MDLEQLRNIAKRFRKALECVPIKERPGGLKEFPSGSCGDATLLLGTYLIELGVEPFDYVLGGRRDPSGEEWTGHAWLEKDGVVVDITADQFPDGPNAIVVLRDSAWHDGFHGKRQNIADYRIYDQNTVAVLGAVYKAIRAELKEMGSLGIAPS